MKKIIATTAAVLLSCSLLNAVSFADEALSADVKVTVSDKDGKLALVKESITVTDIDNDGALTVNDALYIAHEEKFEGGAAAGYGSAFGQYGLSLTKLWGTENGGNYGYYVNNTASMGLADPIKNDDDITAFVYTDVTGYSDKYCWFETETDEVNQNESLTLTLKAAGYDAQWNPVTVNVEGAVISINGKETEYKTDAEGKVTVVLENAGQNLISASSDSMILVPPAALINVAASSEETTAALTEAVTTVSEPASAETTANATSTTVTTTVSSAVTASSAPKTGDKGIGLVFALLTVSAASVIASSGRNEK